MSFCVVCGAENPPCYHLNSKKQKQHIEANGRLKLLGGRLYCLMCIEQMQALVERKTVQIPIKHP